MSPLKEELLVQEPFNDNVFFSLIVERKEDVTSCVTLIFNHMFLLLLDLTNEICFTRDRTACA